MGVVGYEWDERKRQATLKARDIDFADAVFADWNNALTREDTRSEYAERRFVTYAMIDGRLFAIGWTPRAENKRIFTMRKANDRECKLFDASEDDDEHE